jgi:transcriptional regulator with XRE-family HTH domain
MTIKRQQRKVKRTPKEQARIEAIRKKYQREKPGPGQLVASGEYDGPVQAGAYWEVRRVMAELKAERERQGLSLAQLAKRSGLDKGAISKLETGVQVNPTVDTLSRIAAGLGVRLGLTLKPEGETDRAERTDKGSPVESAECQDARGTDKHPLIHLGGRSVDITMTLMRLVAKGLSQVPDLPDSIADADEARQADNLLRLQASVGDELVRHAHGAIAAAANDLATRLKADQTIMKTVQQAIPGVTADEALSVALRVCAGCIDGAKTVRETEMVDLPGGRRGEREITEQERAGYMQYLLAGCTSDHVYAAGVSIGPLDKKERNKQEPVFDGIPAADLNACFAEYFRRYPRQAKTGQRTS